MCIRDRATTERTNALKSRHDSFPYILFEFCYKYIVTFFCTSLDTASIFLYSCSSNIWHNNKTSCGFKWVSIFNNVFGWVTSFTVFWSPCMTLLCRLNGWLVFLNPWSHCLSDHSLFLLSAGIIVNTFNGHLKLAIFLMCSRQVSLFFQICLLCQRSSFIIFFTSALVLC